MTRASSNTTDLRRADYAQLLAEIRATGGVAPATRFALAKKVFAHTAAYDGMITNYLSALEAGSEAAEAGARVPARAEYPATLTLQFAKIQDMRYGENPHQSAAFYETQGENGPSIARAHQIQGKELSFNNILDADAALTLRASIASIETTAKPARTPTTGISRMK